VDSKPPASDGRPGSDPTATKASADSRSLEQRLKAQEDLYASHVDIFSVASRDALEETRLAAGQLLGQARVQGGPEHRIEELRKLRQDFQQLLLRWDDARNVLLDLERSYLRCEERWRRRPQPAGLDTAERSSAVDREWEEDLELSLRLCEKRAAQLLRLGPEALLAERERLDALWKFTSRRQNTEAADSKSSTGAATDPGHLRHGRAWSLRARLPQTLPRLSRAPNRQALTRKPSRLREQRVGKRALWNQPEVKNVRTAAAQTPVRMGEESETWHLERWRASP
jgi:hypothetical protein